jgi:hypothetical protein
VQERHIACHASSCITAPTLGELTVQYFERVVGAQLAAHIAAKHYIA